MGQPGGHDHEVSHQDLHNSSKYAILAQTDTIGDKYDAR